MWLTAVYWQPSSALQVAVSKDPQHVTTDADAWVQPLLAQIG
jgi:hypothetical protein